MVRPLPRKKNGAEGFSIFTTLAASSPRQIRTFDASLLTEYGETEKQASERAAPRNAKIVTNNTLERVGTRKLQKKKLTTLIVLFDFGQNEKNLLLPLCLRKTDPGRLRILRFSGNTREEQNTKTLTLQKPLCPNNLRDFEIQSAPHEFYTPTTELPMIQ